MVVEAYLGRTEDDEIPPSFSWTSWERGLRWTSWDQDWLSLRIGFKPFLENAQRTMGLESESQLELQRSKSQSNQQSSHFPDSSSTVRD